MVVGVPSFIKALRKTGNKMKRIFYKLIVRLRKLYWFMFRPKTTGVKVVVECKGDILMIKNSYGKNAWTFPGGAVRKNESLEDAGKREVMEEAGIKVSELKKIGEIFNTFEHKRDTIHLYIGKTQERTIKIDPNEILEAKWFNKDYLPLEISPIAKKIISLRLNK